MRAILESIATVLEEQVQEAYLVGGYVRDLLLGRESHDLDFAVRSGGLTLARRVADRLGGAFVALDTERDTGRVVVRREGALPLLVDFAIFRGDDIEDDLAMRDFTVNAMAVLFSDFVAGRIQIVDPLGGQHDLKARCVRAVSSAVFRDDPARLLRAIRLAKQVGFEIASETSSLIQRDAPLIASISPERVRDELVTILALPGSSEAFRQMDRLNLLEVVLPEVTQLKGIEQSAPHTLDVYDHTLRTLDELEKLLGGVGVGLVGDEDALPEPLRVFSEQLAIHLMAELVGDRARYVIVKLATLLHDVGKPLTYAADEDGRIRFLGHAGMGASLAAAMMRRLHFGNREEALVKTLVWNHMRPLLLSREKTVTRRAIYRFFRDTRDTGLDILLFSLADYRATSEARREGPAAERFAAMVAGMMHAYFEEHSAVIAPPRLLDGYDLMAAFGLRPGPRIGELLEAVRERQAEGKITTRDEAVDFVASELNYEHNGE